jgi:hypothetical protein
MPSLIRPSFTPTSTGEGALAFLPHAVLIGATARMFER